MQQNFTSAALPVIVFSTVKRRKVATTLPTTSRPILADSIRPVDGAARLLGCTVATRCDRLWNGSDTAITGSITTQYDCRWRKLLLRHRCLLCLIAMWTRGRNWWVDIQNCSVDAWCRQWTVNARRVTVCPRVGWPEWRSTTQTEYRSRDRTLWRHEHWTCAQWRTLLRRLATVIKSRRMETCCSHRRSTTRLVDGHARVLDKKVLHRAGVGVRWHRFRCRETWWRGYNPTFLHARMDYKLWLWWRVTQCCITLRREIKLVSYGNNFEIRMDFVLKKLSLKLLLLKSHMAACSTLKNEFDRLSDHSTADEAKLSWIWSV